MDLGTKSPRDQQESTNHTWRTTVLKPVKAEAPGRNRADEPKCGLVATTLVKNPTCASKGDLVSSILSTIIERAPSPRRQRGQSYL